MTVNQGISRRTALGVLAGAAAGTAISGFSPLSRALAAKKLMVGFIYVGPRDDFGYNQAHAEAAAALRSMSGIKVVEEEKVAETLDVQKTMESMINLDGAGLVFPTSFGYFDPHMLKVAQKYPDVEFRHCGGMFKAGVHPANTGSYFGYIDEGQYLNGVAAGHATKSKKLGFVAAKPIPQVLRNINAFTLGARSVDPAITTQVIFTGDWSMPVKEAEATNGLVNAGVDVVTCHVDSPKVVVETAERRGAYTCGYHANQAPLAPKGYLTGAEWNWITVYKDFVTKAQAGEKPGQFVRGGLKEGFIKTSAYGPAVSSESKAAGEAIKAKMMAGDFPIFAGPIRSNTGAEVIPAGKTYGQTDLWLEGMDWLAEGVVGSTS
ncbi:BMP family ABC transporter substrate-binding protein [Skermanella pratensis]|uniref:BMP family ABC transporter substrate-binding protein n=1 Tax=Skermanella pratensis TaxID=2233999 RepID=UPI0013014184|nr:BMP family ABC transporter substrate-binding protein [Skermanella pratensis]